MTHGIRPNNRFLRASGHCDAHGVAKCLRLHSPGERNEYRTMATQFIKVVLALHGAVHHWT